MDGLPLGSNEGATNAISTEIVNGRSYQSVRVISSIERMITAPSEILDFLEHLPFRAKVTLLTMSGETLWGTLLHIDTGSLTGILVSDDDDGSGFETVCHFKIGELNGVSIDWFPFV